jgi:hypothetical protein
MGNSVVDLGAAGEYISEKFDDFVDYFTGAPEARASNTYIVKKSRKGQTLYSGENPESQTFFEYLGFAGGGDVPLQDDGSLPGVDDLRFMTPEEVETGSYNYLQDMEKQMMYHLSEAQNPVEMQGDVFPTQRSVDNTRYHYEEAEKLRDQIDLFRERRASAVLNYPESDQKLYMKEGQDPYVRGFPDSIVEGYQKGGIVDLGEGSPMSVATKEELEEFLKFLRMNRPSYKEGESGKEYRVYSDLLEPTPHNPNAKIEVDGRIVQLPPIPPSFAGQDVGEREVIGDDGKPKMVPRGLYDDFADTSYGITSQDIQSGAASLADLQDSASLGDPFAGREGSFVPKQIEIEEGKVTTNPIGFENGGGIPEAGIGSFMYDVATGNVPSDQYNAMRTSGRMDDPMAQAIYGQEPTFMEQLVTDYNYPANIPMQDEEGYAIMDPETGKQKMMMATDFNLPEYMRTGRPRPDMPTYGELEDARAHALASALMAKDYGPETAGIATKIKEATEMLPGFGSSKFKDIKMDNRNNALGVKLLKEAGINATPKQLARTVDQEVFKQLDRILGRTEERQKTPAKDQPFAKQYFKSPKGGLDVYFPRDKQGYFDTSYIYD